MTAVPLKPELLSPAGDLEKFYAAVQYGADAVYLGGTQFGLRAAAATFDLERLKTAVSHAHSHNVRVYLTCNTLPRNADLSAFPAYIHACAEAGVDAAIVSDLGLMEMVKTAAPQLDLHVSTQAGVVNYAAANAFYKLGAKRVVLARELSLREIQTIRRNTPADLELEVFVHGAMCVSFSGRCLLSNYLTDRDANRGECAQPCRWKYSLVEEKRPNEYYPVVEGDDGAYILNAKDLCMIEHLDKLAEAGVSSLKIEGRAKSFYYVSVVTNAYRIALDRLFSDPARYTCPPWLLEEVSKVSHRTYSTGFFFGRPEQGQCYENGGYIRTYDVIATVDDCKDDCLYCTQRNKFSVGDRVELLRPKEQPVSFTVTRILDEAGEELETARHPMARIGLPCRYVAPKGSILRKEKPDACADG